MANPNTNTNLPRTQRALIYPTLSPPTTSSLILTTTAPLPHPSPSELLIRVHSTAITNKELTWAPYVNWPSEHVPCYDVSGTIVSTAPASPFKIGDVIYGRVDGNREGTAREYATILSSEAALVPKVLVERGAEGMDEAASIPMSALTAWQGLFEHGGLVTGEYTASNVPRVSETGEVVGGQAEGKRVLVLGAAGGVGLMAVQFARIAGAWVVGTASGGNEELVKRAGADEVVDYRKVSMKEWVAGDEGKKFDLVLDCVGGESMLDGWNAVKGDGVYVSVAPGFRKPDEGGKYGGVRSAWFVMESRGSELEGIGKFIEKGLVRGAVDSVWKFKEFNEAFEKTAGGHARGKVVIRIAEE
ncbi:NAD(P)-binding protein [Byssothecium circinans]|uniref:NAD(P)-binding protein n=1 Tax=Byssothecium circinans TaxID=147558 RepID=A0A6A5U419_9PLEO|nr:NAD(P)-binding protein [Byssothecium circinans]